MVWTLCFSAQHSRMNNSITLEKNSLKDERYQKIPHCRLIFASGIDTIPNRSASTFSRLERFCSSVGFNTARFIKLFSLKTNTRNICFILRQKVFFGLFIGLIKGIDIFQTFLILYFRFAASFRQISFNSNKLFPISF